MKTLIILASLLVLIACPCYAFYNTNSLDNSNLSKDVNPDEEHLGQADEVEFKADEILVRFKHDTPKDQIAKVFAKYNLTIIDYVQPLEIYKVNITSGLDPRKVAASLKSNEASIEEAELNIRYNEYSRYNPYFDEKDKNDNSKPLSYWQFRYLQSLSNLLQPVKKITTTSVQSISTASTTSIVKPPITVAIIDSGINPNNPILKDRLVQGWNALDYTNDPSHVQGDSGHGSWVAGAVVLSSSSNVKIMPIKAGDGAFYTWDIITSIVYAAEKGAKVINLSLGGAGYSSLMQYAIDYAYSKGAIIIAAAGNSNTDQKFYPAAYNHAIAVGALATDHTSKAYFSNYGSYVDISAPGQGIITTSATDAGYVTASGTSFSSPLVAGFVASLMQAKNYTNRDIEKLLTKEYTETSLISKIYGRKDTTTTFTTQDLRITDADIYGSTTASSSSYTGQFGTLTYQNTKTTFSNLQYDTKGRLSGITRTASIQTIDKNGNTQTNTLVPERLAFDIATLGITKKNSFVTGFTEITTIKGKGLTAITRNVANISYSTNGLVAGYSETITDYLSNPNYLKMSKTGNLIQNITTKTAYGFKYDTKSNLRTYSEKEIDSTNKDFYSVFTYDQTNTRMADGNPLITRTERKYTSAGYLVATNTIRVFGYTSLKDLAITYNQVGEMNPRPAPMVEAPKPKQTLPNIPVNPPAPLPVPVQVIPQLPQAPKLPPSLPPTPPRVPGMAKTFSVEIAEKIEFEKGIAKSSGKNYDPILRVGMKFKDK